MIKRKEIKKLLKLDSLAPGAKSNLLDCKTLDLTKASSLALTVRATFASDATGGIEVHVVTSPDDSVYDTQDYFSYSISAEPGKEAQFTQRIDPEPSYLKVVLENLDTTYSVTDLDVWATVGYEE